MYAGNPQRKANNASKTLHRSMAAVTIIIGVLFLLWWWALPRVMLSCARTGHFSCVQCLRLLGVRADGFKPGFLDAAKLGDRDAVQLYLDVGVDPKASEIQIPLGWYIGQPGMRTAL